MSRKIFQYYIVNKDGLPYYREKGTNLIKLGDVNLLKPDGQPAQLQYSPDGWKDTLIKYGRNLKYIGLFRDMTDPMRFYGDGADILSYLMWLKDGGVEVDAWLDIHKFDKYNLPYQYKQWHLTQFDMMKYLQSKNGVQLQALEGGLSKVVKNNEDTPYSIDIDDPEMATLYHDGMAINNVATFMVGQQTPSGDFYYYRNHIVDLQIIQSEVSDRGLVSSVPRTKVNNVNSDIKATGFAVFRASADGDLSAEWDFDIDMEYQPPPGINPSMQMLCVLRVIPPNNISTQELQLQVRNNIGVGFTGVRHAVGSGVLHLKKDDQVYLYTFVTVTGASGDAQMTWTYGGNASLKLSYVFRNPATYIDGLLPLTLAKRLLSKMSDNNPDYSIQSAFLTARAQDILLSSMDRVRGIPNAVIHTSFSDFFKAFDCQYGIGMGIKGNTMIIEEAAYFFRNDLQIFDIGELTDWEITVADEWMYSSGRFGYEKQDYQGTNGKTEFNNGQHWTFPHTKFSKKLDKESPYRADPVGIELYRGDMAGKTTTDNESDNDTAMFNVKRTVNNATLVALKFTPQSGNFPLTFKYDTITSKFFFNVTEGGTKFEYTGGVDQSVNIQLFYQPQKTDGSTVKINIIRNDTDVLASTVVPGDGAPKVFNLNNLLLHKNDWLKIVADSSGAGVGNVTILTTDLAIYFQNIYIYELNRPAFTAISGVPNTDEIYNVLLSPKSGLLRNGGLLHSIMDREEIKQLVMTSADKNADLSYTLNGVTVTEKDPVVVSSLPAKLFLPYIIKGKTETPFNYKEIMDDNPYGKIKFTINGNVFYGFMNDGGVKPATMDVQTWELLSCPDNDFSKIKRGQTLGL